MSKLFRFATNLVLMSLVLGCAGSAQPKPQWVTAPDTDIPGLATFTWADTAGGPPLTILDTQVRNALRAELLKKGYAESSDAPDFVVTYETDIFETAKKSNPVSIGIGMGSWGSNVGGSVGTSVGVGGDKAPRLQHRLTIHALDPESDRELWIGNTTTFEVPADASVVEQAVAGVMAGFPDKRN